MYSKCKWEEKLQSVNYTTVIKTILKIKRLIQIVEIKVSNTPEFLKSVLNKFNLLWDIYIFKLACLFGNYV